MKTEDIHNSKTVRGIIIGIGITVLVLIILWVGIDIGYRKARFAGQFGDNFERNFLGPRGGERGMMYNENIPGGHGASGKIISVNLPQFVVSGADNLEKTITVGTTTVIRSFQEDIAVSNLQVGGYVVVLGNPNENGQIEASLVRIMPEPGEGIIKNHFK